MNQKKWSSWIFIAIILMNDVVLSAYHWKVSDNGRTIKAVPDSAYQLKFPGSLTDFLHQVDNFRRVSVKLNEIEKIVKKIMKHENFDNPKFEEEFKLKEEACVKSKNIKLEPENFQTSFSAELCPEFHETYQRYSSFVEEYFGSPPDNDKRPPRCNYWSEAVKIKGANNLDLDLAQIQIPEKVTSEDELYFNIMILYFPSFSKLVKGTDAFKTHGHMLSSMLSHSDEKISKNAYLYMATAAYWRAHGRLSEAWECYKTGSALIEEPIDSTSSRLVIQAMKQAMATLLNRAGYSIEAYTILKQLSTMKNVNCYQAMILAAAGDASVLTGPEEKANHPSPLPTIQLKLTAKERQGVFSKTFQNYATAAHFFKEAKKDHNEEDNGMFDQFFDLNEAKAYTLSCHIRLYEALEKQKENLEQLVSEKNNFQKVYDQRMNASQKLLSLLASEELRVYQRLFYDLAKYGPHPNRKCSPVKFNRFPNSEHKMNMATLIMCTLNVEEYVYDKSMEDVRKATLSKRPPVNESGWNVVEVFTRNRSFERNLLEISKKQSSSDYFRMIEPKYSNKKNDENRYRPWRRADWPNSVDCQAVVSSSNPFRIETFPQVFISPENRGWIISELLTTHLSLSNNEMMPLPWFEPRCDFVDLNDLRVFTSSEAVERLLNPIFDRRNENFAEKMLKTVLVRLADRVIDDSEMGARIHALLTYKIGPQWVAMNLAGLYWRVHGNAHQATKCLLGAFLNKPQESFISIIQMTQVILKTTRMTNDAHDFMQRQLNLLGSREPLYHYIQGRLKLLLHDVDKAIQHLKFSLDIEPNDEKVAEDLLKIACSGKSTKPAISSQFPTVCCSPLVQNAVCIRTRKDDVEQCYVVDSTNQMTPRLIYHRCNGIYDGQSKRTSDFANIVSPFLLVFNTVTRHDDVSNWIDNVDGVQTIESNELPLDYGGTSAFFAPRPAEWWENARHEMRYELPQTEDDTSTAAVADDWEEEWPSDLATIPPKPLSFLWIRDKSLMMQYDAKLPSHLPEPSIHQIRQGMAIFMSPRLTTISCITVAQLDVLFDNPPSTWVSVTAKGEDIEKYVDLKGPIPAIASLQPICPSHDDYENSPILGLDHIPAFALSDQFLFYKPEKALAEALKSLGNERETIEHVAARLHAAMLHNSAKNGKVNWLLCVLSSLYWRVTGHAENAIGCLRCALHTAPPQMRDVALVSLANICHQAGLLNTALIVAGAALSTSPRLVAIHFTLGNIYASIGDYQRALNFYYSTLSLQLNFQPAKDRIRAIYCHTHQEFDF